MSEFERISTFGRVRLTEIYGLEQWLGESGYDQRRRSKTFVFEPEGGLL